MPNGQLVLDIFDGGRLLTRGFESCGFTVVGGPELIFGQDIKGWRPPAGRFDGVIGGPPCQQFSTASHIAGGSQALDLIPEFCAIVASARPQWFVMENVRGAPLPAVPGYATASYLLNRLSLGVAKQRTRRFTFGILVDPRAGNATGAYCCRTFENAMADVLPRRLWAKHWFPTHPLDPPAAECKPQRALMARDSRGTAHAPSTNGSGQREGIPGWLKHELQPALLATDGKSHLRSGKQAGIDAANGVPAMPSGVTGWNGSTITVDMAWAAQELPGAPPDLWINGEFLRKAGAIRLLGNGVPFDMGCHVARAVSLALGLGDPGSVVRWPEHAMFGKEDNAAPEPAEVAA